MKRTFLTDARFLAGLVLIVSLSFGTSAHAQLPWRWFGTKADNAPPPAKPMMPDSRRIAEVNVEVAWLADPITFPYYLEAHVANSQLEMRGYVPDKAVRSHALRIAQVYSSLPVTDALKEHPSLLVRPSTMSPQQLQSSAQSSLRVAMPRQSSQLQIECRADGKVFVAGPVNTYDEKIAVSHALRRLQGCTSVQNLTTLPTELAQMPPPLVSKEKTPIVKVSNPSDKPVVAVPERPAETRSRWLFWPFKKSSATKDEPPLFESQKKSDGPIEIPNFPAATGTPEIIKMESSTAALTPAALQQRILAVCKQAKGADVQFPTANQVRITVEIRADNDVGPAAETILALPELRNYRPDLLFKVAAP